MKTSYPKFTIWNISPDGTCHPSRFGKFFTFAEAKKQVKLLMSDNKENGYEQSFKIIKDAEEWLYEHS